MQFLLFLVFHSTAMIKDESIECFLKKNSNMWYRIPFPILNILIFDANVCSDVVGCIPMYMTASMMSKDGNG